MPALSQRAPVSVIIAAYNAGAHLSTALDSVLAQSYAPKEIIVVDHGSQDETAAVGRAYAARDSRVRVMSIPGGRGGPSVPRNVGIGVASGEWIAFLDSDDLWTTDRLRDQMEVIERNPDLVLVYSMLRTIDAPGPLTSDFGLLPFPLRAAYTLEDLRKDNTIGCSATIARAASIRSAGGFDESPQLVAIEDYDLWLKLSALGPIGFIPRVHGYYRVHQKQLTARTNMQLRAMELFARHNIPLPAAVPMDRPLHFRITRMTAHLVAMGVEKFARFSGALLRRPVPVWRPPATSKHSRG